MKTTLSTLLSTTHSKKHIFSHAQHLSSKHRFYETCSQCVTSSNTSLSPPPNTNCTPTKTHGLQSTDTKNHFLLDSKF